MAAPNAAPVLQPVGNRSASEGEAVSIQLVATDADHAADALTYTLVSGPAGATVSADGLVQWTAAGVGDQAFTVRVTDPAGASSERSFTISVRSEERRVGKEGVSTCRARCWQ